MAFSKLSLAIIHGGSKAAEYAVIMRRHPELVLLDLVYIISGNNMHEHLMAF